jgi:hypothetical protein
VFTVGATAVTLPPLEIAFRVVAVGSEQP